MLLVFFCSISNPITAISFLLLWPSEAKKIKKNRLASLHLPFHQQTRFTSSTRTFLEIKTNSTNMPDEATKGSATIPPSSSTPFWWREKRSPKVQYHRSAYPRSRSSDADCRQGNEARTEPVKNILPNEIQLTFFLDPLKSSKHLELLAFCSSSKKKTGNTMNSKMRWGGLVPCSRNSKTFHN